MLDNNEVHTFAMVASVVLKRKFSGGRSQKEAACSSTALNSHPRLNEEEAVEDDRIEEAAKEAAVAASALEDRGKSGKSSHHHHRATLKTLDVI